MKDSDPLKYGHWRLGMAPAIKKHFPTREEVDRQIAQAEGGGGEDLTRTRLREIVGRTVS